MSKIRKVAIALVAIITVPLLTAGACAAERSTEKFCEVYNDEKQEYLAKYGGEPGDTFTALTNLVGAISAWVPMFDRLAKHAPDEIQSDVELIRDSLKQSQDNAGNSVQDPWGTLAQGFITGLMTWDSWERLGTFVENNCVTEEELAIRAEQAAAAEEAARIEEAARRAEQAEDEARYAIETLSSELTWLRDEENYPDEGVYAAAVDSFREYHLADAEYILERAKEEASNEWNFDSDGWYCEYPEDAPWRTALNDIDWTIENAGESASTWLDYEIGWDSAWLEDLVFEGESATGDLGRAVPDSPMVNTLQKMTKEVRGFIDRAETDRAESQAEINDIVAEVETYRAKVESVVDKADAKLGC